MTKATKYLRYVSLLVCYKRTSKAIKSAVHNILEYMGVTHSHNYKNELLKFKGRLDILPLGIDPDFIRQLRKTAREPYNIPHCRQLIIESFIWQQ